VYAAAPSLIMIPDVLVLNGVIIELVSLPLIGLPHLDRHILLDEVELFLSYL
jgi:hypothetical protein